MDLIDHCFSQVNHCRHSRTPRNCAISATEAGAGTRLAAIYSSVPQGVRSAGIVYDEEYSMKRLTRITHDPTVMGGKPCIRGLRVTVGTIVGLMASGQSVEEILKAYPYLEEQDIREALAYAAWRAEESEVPVS